jgi:hypothetical protein
MFSQILHRATSIQDITYIQLPDTCIPKTKYFFEESQSESLGITSEQCDYYRGTTKMIYINICKEADLFQCLTGCGVVLTSYLHLTVRLNGWSHSIYIYIYIYIQDMMMMITGYLNLTSFICSTWLLGLIPGRVRGLFFPTARLYRLWDPQNIVKESITDSLFQKIMIPQQEVVRSSCLAKG